MRSDVNRSQRGGVTGGVTAGVGIILLWSLVATVLWASGCQPDWPRTATATADDVSAAGRAGDGLAAADRGPVRPACRPAATGELVINEVVLRPGGLDLDHDGASNGRDEVVEIVSRADEAIHLQGASLWWRGERRGGVLSGACLWPRTAAVLAFEESGDLKLPRGAEMILLDRTLRLSDRGGKIELRGVNGTVLDAVAVPAAVTPDAPAVWSRSRDADWQTGLISHNEVPGATRPSSLGRCADGARYPCCIAWLDERAELGQLSEQPISISSE